MLVKACQIDYEDGPISEEYTLIHTRGWHLGNLFRNLKHDAIVCMSMGDNGLEWDQRYVIKRWFEKPYIEFSELPEHIKHLYCTHCAVKHGRISGVPAGVMFTEDGTNFAALEEVEKLPIPKTKLLYVNFGDTHPSRPILREQFKWATVDESCEPLEYFKRMKQYKYVLCPRGHGPDSYRVWEALYMGCIPIVPSVEIGGCHDHFDLPILQTRDWNLNPQLLEKIWQKPEIGNVLTEEYWINKIRKHHEDLLLS
jgi:hypothetical protein